MNVVRGIVGRFTNFASWLRAIILLRLQRGRAGRGCSLAAGVRLRATDGAKIIFGNHVTIDRFTDLNAKHGFLLIGSRTYVGQFCVICARKDIRIGTDCLIAEHVTIRDQDHIFRGRKPTRASGFVTAPIRIGDNVWLGAKVTVLKGITIGDNSVIGANSVVTRNIPANSVAVGNPARVIRKIEKVS